MRILRNNALIERQSENYIKAETSNVAAVLETPQVLVELFYINPDLSTNLDGYQNIDDFIDPTSTVVYDYVDKYPISGIDSFVNQVDFDEEMGFDTDLQSSGVTFPNMVTPKPNDFFLVKTAKYDALFVITDVKYSTVRSNSFNEISFRLYSHNPETIKQLRRQVKDRYVTTVTAIGPDKSLTIKEDAYFKIQDMVKDYISLLNMYVSLFYDTKRAAFVFDGIPAKDNPSIKEIYIDMTLWKFMFDNRIIIFDDVVTYNNNNYEGLEVDRIYTDCPDVYIDEHQYNKSIIVRLFNKERRKYFAECRFPQSYEENSQITKFTGVHVIYLEQYGPTCDCNGFCMSGKVFNDEFIERIEHNVPYPPCCEDVNPTLRNAIIRYFNDEDVNFDDIYIDDDRTNENYLLIPLLLGIYKKAIIHMEK